MNNWHRWAGADVVRAWLKIELATPVRRLDFLGRYVGEATSGSEVVSYSFPARFLEGLIDLEETAKAVASVPTEDVREQVARELLDEAQKLKQAAQPYDTMEVDADRRTRRMRRR